MTLNKSALVCGAGGFIGSHLVKRLKKDGYWVRGVDLKHPEFSASAADEFFTTDLRDAHSAAGAVDRPFDEVYQLAADMGGAGYLFTGDHDADIMRNSVTINLNVLEACRRGMVGRVFFSSSACVYPVGNQLNPTAPVTREDSVYPAEPDSEYGWEKLFSERLYAAYRRDYGLQTRVGRYHNVFGPEGTWTGGKEKVPAAMCRKVAEAEDGGTLEIWGDGEQTRSFLYIDECLEATVRLTRSDVCEPINIGSEEMVSVNELARMVMGIAGKSLRLEHIPGPLGVRGRNSHNQLIEKSLGWRPTRPLREGLGRVYPWVRDQVVMAGEGLPPAPATRSAVHG